MSDRIDEYHGAEAKVLTTDEVERWQEFLGDGIQLRRTLATTRALEKAVAEFDSARFARDRYANTIGQIESAVGFSGANPVEETIERVRRLMAERDEAIARAEKAETKAAADAMRDWDSLRQEFEANVTTLRARAEKAQCDALEAQGSEDGLVRELNSAQDRALARLRERDEARAEVERRDALISRDGYEDMRQHAADLAQRLETAERERDEAMRLAYVGEHRFEDQTWKTRCEGVVAELRSTALERDEARAEVERRDALARVAELEKTLGDSAKSRDWPCLDCQPESPEKASLKTIVAELVDASERLLEHYSDGLTDHLVDEFRAALAKAKGAKP